MLCRLAPPVGFRLSALPGMHKRSRRLLPRARCTPCAAGLPRSAAERPSSRAAFLAARTLPRKRRRPGGGVALSLRSVCVLRRGRAGRLHKNRLSARQGVAAAGFAADDNWPYVRGVLGRARGPTVRTLDLGRRCSPAAGRCVGGRGGRGLRHEARVRGAQAPYTLAALQRERSDRVRVARLLPA